MIQPGRQEERGGLRDAFHTGGGGGGGGGDGDGDGVSPRLSAGMRGAGTSSPRLLAPLSISGSPSGDAIGGSITDSCYIIYMETILNVVSIENICVLLYA